jgi:hypothetical protein
MSLYVKQEIESKFSRHGSTTVNVPLTISTSHNEEAPPVPPAANHHSFKLYTPKNLQVRPTTPQVYRD